MNYLQANLCLLCVTLCWSTEVVIFACIPDVVSPFAVTSITFLAGGALLLLAFWRRIAAGLKEDRTDYPGGGPDLPGSGRRALRPVGDREQYRVSHRLRDSHHDPPAGGTGIPAPLQKIKKPPVVRRFWLPFFSPSAGDVY